MVLRRVSNLVKQSSRRLVSSDALRRRHWLYRDNVVKLDEGELIIRAYYWPTGSKRIQYSEIVRFHRRALRPWQGQFRVQGVDLRRRWYSRDRRRGEKEIAIDLDIGKLFRPVLTPNDPEEVLQILEQRVPA